MAESVRMEHPNLPGQVITVSPLAVPHYQASGWEPATGPEPDPRKPKRAASPETTPEAPADAGASALPDSDSETSVKRRRTQTPKEES